nr:MAG TPA: hypothetical protein [Caudoviricetes sp.]
MAAKTPEIDEATRKKEYLALFEIFSRLIDSTSGSEEQWDILEELMDLRAEFAISHAIKGFGMDYEKAIELIKGFENLSEEEKGQRDILIAAIDNLVDFAVAEEYQMCVNIFDKESDDEENENGDFTQSVFYKYNYQYAQVENLDIIYAMAIAFEISKAKGNTILTYMSQGDERVRPWHLQYEGFSAPKSDFPAWLIPPIENMCRCYLLYDDGPEASERLINKVLAKSSPEKPDWINPVFEESVALGGKIFSSAHRYFQIDKRHKKRLKQIAGKVKDKYLKANG